MLLGGKTGFMVSFSLAKTSSDIFLLRLPAFIDDD